MDKEIRLNEILPILENGIWLISRAEFLNTEELNLFVCDFNGIRLRCAFASQA